MNQSLNQSSFQTSNVPGGTFLSKVSFFDVLKRIE
jgi:hypothetical protein